MTLRQISVFLENHQGSLVELTDILAKEAINISAFSIADTTDFGIARLIVDKPDKAYEKLTEAGIPVFITEVIAVKLEDKPGSLHKVLSVLSDGNISIEYSYAFFSPSSEPFAIIRVADNNLASKTLENAGIAAATESELF